MLSAEQHPTSGAASANVETQRTLRIRELNDAFRRKLPRTSKGYRLNLTAGVASLGATLVAQLLLSVRSFVHFSPDNDPHGEHDFGAIDQDGTKVFWKIDCYDQWIQFGSPDPTDPSVTTRVMTIMLASEY
ncbi:Protein of unknown function [Tardiphaga sp. OK246]|uniref:DUF3768 domain-containing protein n=1 Tax=Tardiphaga sp. OK246 TaxID=1855307 RepID=UPI000B72C941|nr:DUF3768 domain-containing protein [Tardiphaga sp. OK246]SNT61583.1 Protein of unknown function [Tardiphaga sp. OK246]